MDASGVRERAADLPREPGVYQFLAGGDPLYVGKAVDLRDRVRSYADPRSERVARMVERADAVDVAVTDTETQALLLEANLIKRHNPRYNVRLRDDKSYPLVQLTDHEAPRIAVTRDPAPDATVFGPYTEKGRLDVVVKAIRDVYGLRGCSDHKYANRDRPCLDHDIGLCAAPCTGECDPATYREGVEAARRFFEGETGALADPLREAMDAAAERGAFERAATLRDRLDAVESFHETGGAAVAGGNDDGRVVDVLGVAVEGGEATVARLRSERGKLVDRDRHVLDGAAASAGAALAAFVPQFYADRGLPDELLLSDRLETPALDGAGADAGESRDGERGPAGTTGDGTAGTGAVRAADVEDWLEGAGVEVGVPGAGRGGRLVDLALKNARRRSPDRDELAVLGDALGDLLDGDRPERIEGFDVSHTGGRGVVGSDVTFVGGTPEKADYRRKRLPDANDDCAAMAALCRWRAERAVEGRDDRPAPDLLVVDGGAAQRDAAVEAVGEAGWDVPVVGIAKGEDRRDGATDRVVGPDGTYDWPADSPQLGVCQRVRDEAHRFARRYHETVRDDVSTVLDEIDGVGETRRRHLLRRFGSVQGVREASEAELADVPGIGASTAETIARRL
ncbi:MAG: excinuclease ABC subunit C [Halobacteriaceae archaeon]